MTNTNITRDNAKKQILNIRQYNYQQRKLDRRRRIGYTLTLIQAFWDLKRCEEYPQMKYPLSIMIWSLSRIIEKLGGRFKLPPESVIAPSLNFWININNIEVDLWKTLDYLDLSHNEPVGKLNTIAAFQHFNSVLISLKAVAVLAGHDLEHLLYLALQYGKEYVHFEAEDRIRELNKIRKKVLYGAREKHLHYQGMELTGIEKVPKEMKQDTLPSSTETDENIGKTITKQENHKKESLNQKQKKQEISSREYLREDQNESALYNLSQENVAGMDEYVWVNPYEYDLLQNASIFTLTK